MLTATEANKLRSNIQLALLKIGKTNGTTLPKSSTNTGQVAAEYWLWSFVAKLASNKYKEIEKEAVRSSVIFDKDKKREPAGTKKMVYTSDVANVLLEVRNASESIDNNKLKHELRVLGVSETVIEQAFAKAITKKAAPHFFTPYLVEQL